MKIDSTNKTNPVPLPEITSNKKQAKTSPEIAKQKQKMVRPKEAEDIHKKPFKLTRVASSQNLTRVRETEAFQTEKEADMESKSTDIWKCIDRKPDESGGYIYQFKLITTYRELQSGRHFPAIQYTKKLWSISNQSIRELVTQWFHHEQEMTFEEYKNIPNDFLNLRKAHIYTEFLSFRVEILGPREITHLGFSSSFVNDGIYLEIPDRTSLLAKWEKLREIKSDLPSIDIALSDGITDDISFVMAYLNNDVLVSAKKEFIHDNIVHVIPLLFNLLNYGKDATTAKKQMALKILTFYKNLEIVKLKITNGTLIAVTQDTNKLKDNITVIETILGACVDAISSVSANSQKFKFFESKFPDIIMSSKWINYFNDRYPGKEIDEKLLRELWRLMNSAAVIEIKCDSPTVKYNNFFVSRGFTRALERIMKLFTPYF